MTTTPHTHTPAPTPQEVEAMRALLSFFARWADSNNAQHEDRALIDTLRAYLARVDAAAAQPPAAADDGVTARCANCGGGMRIPGHWGIDGTNYRYTRCRCGDTRLVERVVFADPDSDTETIHAKRKSKRQAVRDFVFAKDVAYCALRFRLPLPRGQCVHIEATSDFTKNSRPRRWIAMDWQGYCLPISGTREGVSLMPDRVVGDEYAAWIKAHGFKSLEACWQAASKAAAEWFGGDSPRTATGDERRESEGP